MAGKRLGIFVGGANVPGYYGDSPDAGTLLKGIEEAEAMGIGSAWLVTAAPRLDALSVFAAAGPRTKSILFGTGIVPTFGRHPAAMAQQIQVIAQLAPGRFRLGIGSGHRPNIVPVFGSDFRKPLGHVREYVHILKSLLQKGSVDFEGEHYSTHAEIASTVDVPVMISALQPRAFEVAGAEADGAITWVTPAPYLRDVAIPAMKAGAEKAGRPLPPLVDGMPVCVHDNPDEVRQVIRERVVHPTLVFYQEMWAKAGYPEAAEGYWTDHMLDASAIFGNEDQVRQKLEERFSLGLDEVITSPTPAGADWDASLKRTLRLLVDVGRSLGG